MPINWDSTFSYQDKDSVNELILAPATEYPAIRDTFGVVEGVKGRQAVHYLNRVGKLTKRDPGCDNNPTPMQATTTLKMWDPQDAEIYVYECWKNLRGQVLEWRFKNGNDKSDLTNTDVEDYYFELLADAAFRDLRRIGWFGDTAITAASLTNGAGDVPNYNVFNGIWKQIFAAEAAGKFVHVPIADNDEATSAGQELEDGDAFPIFQALFNKAPQRLKALSMSDRQFMVSDTLFTEYLNYRESRNLDNSFDIQESGVSTLRYRGVPIQVVNEWDSIIAADFFKAGKRDKPNRAILTQKGNLQLAFDGQPLDTPTDRPFVSWYDIKSKNWYARLNYTADSKLADDGLLIAAY